MNTRNFVALFFALLMQLPLWSHAEFPGENGVIAFFYNGNVQTIAANGEGSPTEIFDGFGLKTLRWSPDGTKLALAADGVGNYSAIIYSADGSSSEILYPSSPSRYVDSPNFIKGSDKLAAILSIADGTESSPGIYLIDPAQPEFDVNNPNSPKLVVLGDFLTDMVTSPDGSEVAYVDDGAICIAALEEMTQSEHCITNETELADSHLDWSPDGAKIVFRRASREFNSTGDIFIIPAKGGEAAKLATDDANEYNPRWSPDGKFIVYARCEGDPKKCTIVRIGADGSNQTTVADGGFGGPSYTKPAWQPLPKDDGGGKKKKKKKNKKKKKHKKKKKK